MLQKSPEIIVLLTSLFGLCLVDHLVKPQKDQDNTYKIHILNMEIFVET